MWVWATATATETATSTSTSTAPAAWSESVSALRVVRFAAMLASARRDDDASVSALRVLIILYNYLKVSNRLNDFHICN